MSREKGISTFISAENEKTVHNAHTALRRLRDGVHLLRQGSRLQLLMQPGEQADAAPRRLGVERAAILRHLGAEEARESLTHRGRLRVVADEQRRHVS